MDEQKRLHQLRSVHERIADLSIVKCRMSHERVVRAGDSGLPVIGRLSEGSYKRVGLCTPEQRAMRIGCSHTTARILLYDAIRELATDRAEKSAGLGEELTSLDNAIHLLDHQKGEAEKALASALIAAYRAGEQSDSVENVRKAQSELGDLEHRHDAYVERMGRLRDSVVSELESLMARHPS